MNIKMKGFLVLVLFFLSGCNAKYWHAYEKPLKKGLTKFSSEAELKSYVDLVESYHEIAKKNPPKIKRRRLRAEEEVMVVTGLRGDIPQSITNNQEVGVDEGDIVKKVGDFLIVLRKGVLHSAFIGSNAGDSMELRSKLNVQDQMKLHDSWYDELLVSKNYVIVIGYSYDLKATELVFFTLDDFGLLEYQWAYFLPSGDYYDGENYATRIVDGSLILVVPTNESLPDIRKRLETQQSNQLLVMRHQANSDNLEEVNILTSRDIYKTGSHVDYWWTTQNVLQCSLKNLSTDGLECAAVSLVGVNGSFYVSPAAVYIWTMDDVKGYDYEQIDVADFVRLSKHGVLKKWNRYNDGEVIYRIDLESREVTGVGVQGSPINQFSFQERSGQFIGVSSYMIDETYDYNTFGLSIPLSEFDSLIPSAKETNYTFLDTSGRDVSANRFSGVNAFISSEDYFDGVASSDVLVWNTDTGAVSNFKAKYRIRAFHPLRDHMLALGDNEDGRLVMGSWQIEPEPKNLLTEYFATRVTAESRSHGFNSAEFGGDLLFGVPVNHMVNKQDEERLWDGLLETDLVFFSYDSNGQFEEINTIFGSELQQEQGECKVSCYDWYGSARPFFINGSVYALMDYELVRANYSNRTLHSLQRLNMQSGEVKFE